jgi:hypothetical protein
MRAGIMQNIDSKLSFNIVLLKMDGTDHKRRKKKTNTVSITVRPSINDATVSRY